jgi:hypothetical protein
MRAGDRILHPKHGAGLVLALKWGHRVRVRLDAAPGLPMTFRRVELAVLDSEPSSGARESSNGKRSGRPNGANSAAAADGNGRGSGRRTRLAGPWTNGHKPPQRPAKGRARRVPKTAVISAGKAASPEERVELRQTLEALRLGVVPARYVRDYTVGRDAELASFDALLDAGRGLRALWGDYGHGKTHQLEVLERVAQEKSFVTARVTLDPREVPPTHPKRLYQAIVSALSLPNDGGEGLEPLLRGLVDSAAHRDADGKNASRFFSPYLHALHHGDDELTAWMHDYASGLDVDRPKLLQRLSRAGWRGAPPLKLSDFRTYGRMYIHMLGTLACWTRDAGFRGLLLLFDEVEGVDQLTKTELIYGVQTLMHFAAVTVPKSNLGFDPSRHAHLYRGGHPVHRKIPLRFERKQPLSVVFAFTPLDEIRTLFREIVVDESLDIHLRPLVNRDTLTLVERVCQLYVRTYPDFAVTGKQLVDVTDEIEEAVDEGQSSARDIVRGVVFLLDSIRLARRGSGNGSAG